MIPVFQRIVASGDDKVPGDCVKCCVASLLELPYEEVPHFVAGEWLVTLRTVDGVACGEPYRSDWLTSLNDWLECRGWNLRATNETYWAKQPWESGRLNDRYDRHASLRSSTPGLWCIGTVISENFEDSTHAVVVHGASVAHDPSTKDRRTPYEFVGHTTFTVLDPSKEVRMYKALQVVRGIVLDQRLDLLSRASIASVCEEAIT